MAARGDGSFDRAYLFGHTGVQYVSWVAGTVLGVVVPSLDARALGLDAVFPAFFLACYERGKDARRARVALERRAAGARAGVRSRRRGGRLLVGVTPRRCRPAQAGVSSTTVCSSSCSAPPRRLRQGPRPGADGGRDLPGAGGPRRRPARLGVVSALVVTYALRRRRPAWPSARTPQGCSWPGLLLWCAARPSCSVVVARAAVTAG
jgi:hypothetical protein